LETEQYRIISLQQLRLPSAVDAVTVQSAKGRYQVYVNSDCKKPLEKVIRHEMRHIREGHFEDDFCIELIEKMAEE